MHVKRPKIIAIFSYICLYISPLSLCLKGLKVVFHDKICVEIRNVSLTLEKLVYKVKVPHLLKQRCEKADSLI